MAKCSACGHAYERSALEALQQQEYLVAWLEQYAAAQTLQDQARLQLQTARQALQPAAPPPAAAASPAPAGPPIAAPDHLPTELALARLALAQPAAWVRAGVLNAESAKRLEADMSRRLAALEAAGHRATDAPPSATEAEVLAYVRLRLSDWMRAADLRLGERAQLRAHLEGRLVGQTAPPIPMPSGPPTAPPRPAPLPAAPVPVAVPSAVSQEPPAPAAAPTAAPQVIPPPPPPAPPRPPINWGQVWERGWQLVVSGALLRGLLYLGAFMIVMSAAVLVVAFWNLFPPFLQIGFVAAVPLTFYAGGFFLRWRMKLPLAGSVLTGVGALLVAVDFAAVYRLGGLAGLVDVNLYWLAAAGVCSALYVFTSRRVRGEFFGYLILISLLNVGLAAANVFRLPLHWQAVVLAGLTTAMIAAGVGLRRRTAWPDLATPALRLAQVLLPLLVGTGLVYQLFVPGDQAVAQAALLALVSAGYALLAWQFPHALLAHATVWTSLAAWVFILRGLQLPFAWWAAAAAGLAVGYAEVGRRQARSPHPGHAWAGRGAAGLLLLAAGLIGGLALFIQVWVGVLGLVLATAVLAGWAYQHRQPVFAGLAGALFVVPVTAAAAQWLPAVPALLINPFGLGVWAGLALLYLALAATLRRATRYMAWVHLEAQALALVTLVGLGLNFVNTAYYLYFSHVAWPVGPQLLGWVGVLAVYGLSSILHTSGRHPALSALVSALPAFSPAAFMWPLALILPAAVTLAWWGSVLAVPWVGAALAGLALVYMAVGQVLARRQLAYRLPWHAAAYAVAALAIVPAVEARAALLTTLYLGVAMLAGQALIYRALAPTALAALVLVWPFHLTLAQAGVAAEAYPFAYALVAGLAYIPLGLWRRRAQALNALPLFAVGYGLAALATLTAATIFSSPPAALRWLPVATPLIVTALMIVSANRLKLAAFAWAAVLVLPIAFGMALRWLNVPSAFDAVAWVALAFTYIGVERLLARFNLPSEHWLAPFRLPLGLGAPALWIAGVALTIPDTLAAVDGAVVAPLGLVAAQALAAGVAVSAARLYRSRWLMYLEPLLALSALTLALQGYGEQWFGRELTPAEFSLPWLALAGAHLLAAAAVDQRPTRYAHALYLAGYGLLALAVAWSLPDRLINLIALGALCLVMAASQWGVHHGRHRAFADLLALARLTARPGQTPTALQRGVPLVFLFIGAYALPFWVFQLQTHVGVLLAWRGLGLALLAPLYVAAGLAARRWKAEYTWPLYTAGYALTALGALLAFDHQPLFIYVLALNAVVYGASALIFRQPFWLYLSTILMPIIGLLILNTNGLLTARWATPMLMALAFAYFGVGRLIERRHAPPGLAPFALPFLAPAYLFSAIALAGSLNDRTLTLTLFPAGVVLYALSAWVYREPLFLYPAVWLVAVPYARALTLLPLEPRWYGLAWLPLIAVSLGLGRALFHRRPLFGAGLAPALFHSALPFYLLAYGLSLAALYQSGVDALALTLAAAAVAGLYFFSGLLFGRAAWFYPALLVTHLALLAYFLINPSGRPLHLLSVPFHTLTWIMALGGYAVSRLAPGSTAPTPAGQPAPTGWVAALGGPALWARVRQSRWAAPFFVVAAADVVLWQVVAGASLSTGLTVAAGNFLLLGLFALLWLAPALAYGALGALTLAAVFGFRLAGLAGGNLFGVLAGLGLGYYLATRLAGRLPRVARLRLWVAPLDQAALVLIGAGTALSLIGIGDYPTAAAGALAAAGAYAVGESYRRRNYRIGYGGVALLLLAWSLTLGWLNVAQPQWYALPAGLYLSGVGYLERRIGRKPLALLVESLGLAVLLLTSFIQSLDGGARGLPFFVLLLVEALLALAWGAGRRLKGPFFIGLAASVINVLAQVVLLFAGPSTLIRWLIIGSAGVLIVGVAVFMERQRERIIATAQVWREALETWN